MTAGRPDYLPTLDGWRALAVGLVLAGHASGQVIGPGGPLAWPRGNGYLAALAGFGVEIFFVLSGYLITARLVAERDRTGRVSLSAFYVRRACRILPPVLAYLAVIGSGAAAGWWRWPRADVVATLTFTRNYLPIDRGAYETTHFWSLAVEEHFYLVWPPLLVAAGRRRAVPTVVGLILVALIWNRVENARHLLDAVRPGVKFDWRTDTWCLGLLVGAAGALLDRGPPSRLLGGTLSALGATLAAAFLMVRGLPGVPDLLLLFAMRSTTGRPGGTLGRAFELPPVRWVGRVSYGLYVWQQLFLVPGNVHTPGLL